MTIENLLRPRSSAAVEYWYFKVNSGPVALLVDWIARRNKGQNTLRVSIHTPNSREVIFEDIQGELMGSNNFLNLNHTAGKTKSISWDLSIMSDNKSIHPDIFPASLLNMTDLQAISIPDVSFTGWISYKEEKFTLNQSKGMVSHYWGRRLSPEWWWVSANQFDNPALSIECSFLNSGLWGSKFTIPLGYIYLRQGNKSNLYMASPGAIKVSGSPENFELTFKKLGSPKLILKASGRDYGSLGEGIMNTLVGDLEVVRNDEIIGIAKGTAGLERRNR